MSKNEITLVTSKKKEKIKQFRKEQYNKMMKNNLSNVNLNLSEINIEQFLEARKNELSNFISILDNKISTKSGHQLLPNHMRRRAMSHNPYRIGLRHSIGLFNSNNTSKCKKHKLKKRQLLKSVNRRRLKSGWLETHIWHAKRFKMKSLFGRKLAFYRYDKSIKAILRYLKESSIVYDRSYYMNLLMKFNSEKTVKSFFSIKIFDFSKIYQEFTLKDRAYKVIGPVEVMLCDDSDGKYTYNLMFHPLMYEEILFYMKDYMENNKDELDKDDICLLGNKKINSYEYFGKLDGIYKLFKVLSVREEGEEKDKSYLPYKREEFEATFKSLKSLSEFEKYLDNNEIGFFQIKKPDSSFRINELVINTYLEYMNEEKKSINNDYNDYSSLMKLDNEEGERKTKLEKVNILFDFISKCKDEKEIEIKHITERTNLCRRNKINSSLISKKINEKRGFFKENQVNSRINKEIITIQSKNNNKMMKIKETFHEIFGNDHENLRKDMELQGNSTFLIVTRHSLRNKNLSKDMNYYRIYLISGISNNLLRLLSYLNVKVIGYREYKSIFTEYDKLFFPEDYISSSSYYKHQFSVGIENINTFLKKPPSKRVNFQRIKSVSPFYPCFQLICKDNQPMLIDFNMTTKSNMTNIKNNQVIDVIKNKDNKLKFLIGFRFEPVNKGIPIENSSIHLPSYELLRTFYHIACIKKENNISSNNELYIKMLSTNNHKENQYKLYEDYKLLVNLEEKLEEMLTETVKNNENHNENQSNSQLKQEFLNIIEKISNDKSVLSQEIPTGCYFNKDLSVKLPENTLLYQVIGFITNGRYSYYSSKGVGKGFILVDELIELRKIYKSLEEEEFFKKGSKCWKDLLCNKVVLVKKPTSLKYQLYTITLLDL